MSFSKQTMALSAVAIAVLAYSFFPGQEQNSSVQITSAVEPVAVEQSSQSAMYNSQEPKRIAKRQIQKTNDTRPPLQCRKLLRPNNDIANWRASKKDFINALLTEQKDRGVASNTLDAFFVSSGIGLYKGRNIIGGYDPTYKLPAYGQVVLDKATAQQHTKALSLLATGDDLSLIMAIKNGSVPTDKYYRYTKEPARLLTFLLDNTKKNPQSLAVSLTKAQIPVTQSDLVYATSKGFSVSTVEHMLQAADFDPTQTLTHRFKVTSLALLALNSKNADLAKFWISQGSPLQPDMMDVNALDLLAKNAHQYSVLEADELFILVAEQGLIPNKPNTAKQLKKAISASVFEPFEQQISQAKQPLDTQQQQLVDELTERLYDELLAGYVDFELATTPKHECFDELGLWLTRFISAPKRKTPKPLPSNNQPDKQSEPTKVAGLSPSEIHSKANTIGQPYASVEFDTNDQSLENKLKMENHRRQELSELMNELKESEENNDTTDNQQDLIKQIMQLAQSGQWQSALQLMSDIQTNHAHMYTMLLITAIMQDADSAIIDQLIDRGANMTSAVMTALISKDNVELTKKLKTRGLDLNQDEAGYSTLARSVQWRARNMLKYLLTQGVPSDSNTAGLDALDIALQKYTKLYPETTFIRMLLDAGATVEPSHIQLTENVKQQSLELYSALINDFPQLKS